MRYSSELFDKFGVFVHKYRPGDLVFFSKDGRAPKHMGIIVNDREYIHSPGRKGTRVSIAEIRNEPIPSQYEDQIYFGLEFLMSANNRYTRPVRTERKIEW